MKYLFLSLALLLSACGGNDASNPAAAATLDRGADPFIFSTAPKAAYAQVDRMGQPVVATVLLHTSEKDAFNQDDPARDGNFAGFMTERLEELHEALDRQIMGKGITPCALDVCIRQVINKIIPDTLQLDLSKPDGFPNGRRFADVTVDRILSMALADTTTPGQCNGAPCTDRAFENVPINPTRNDMPFPAEFPYLPAPHP